jgi:hypothetical protein
VGGVVAALVVAGATSLVACAEDFDPNDRRLATQDEYALNDQTCAVRGDRAVATGTLTNHSGRNTGFGVIVRFLDGDVDVGRPREVAHPEPLADGDTWAWEVGHDIDEPPADLRCNVIQVVIGDDVNR